MKNYVLTFLLALLVVLAAQALRRTVGGVGGSPIPWPPAQVVAVGGSPIPWPPAIKEPARAR